MIVNYIIQGIILISYVIVFRLQFIEIKHLKNKLNTLEKFQNIFDIDKIKGYVEILEAENKRRIDEAKTERLEDYFKASVDKALKKVPEDKLKEWAEMYLFTFKILAVSDKNQREKFLLDLKEHEVSLRKLLLDYDKQNP